MNKGRLLIVYAHPDDESFGLGAMIAAYVVKGVDVYLICATDGDVGMVRDEFLANGKTIKDVRLEELDRAARILKLKGVYRLGYKDSGMMGSPDNNDPQSLWQALQDDVIRRTVDIMREIKPHIVITFNKYGGYGHPDHIAIQRAATEAFYKAGDPDYVTDQPPYKPQKLYYSSVPKTQIRLGLVMLRLRGQDPRRMGRNKDIDVQAIVDNAEPIHATVDIGRYFDAWDEASQAHASQLGGGRSTPRLPVAIRKRLFSRQGFTRVYPPPKFHRIDERDLFQGVHLDGGELAPATVPTVTSETEQALP